MLGKQNYSQPQPKRDNKPSRVRLTWVNGVPTVKEMRLLLGEAEKNRGILCELPIHGPQGVFLLSCQSDHLSPDPCFTLYEGEDGTKQVWSYLNNNLEMIADIVGMSVTSKDSKTEVNLPKGEGASSMPAEVATPASTTADNLWKTPTPKAPEPEPAPQPAAPGWGNAADGEAPPPAAPWGQGTPTSPWSMDPAANASPWSTPATAGPEAAPPSNQQTTAAAPDAWRHQQAPASPWTAAQPAQSGWGAQPADPTTAPWQNQPPAGASPWANQPPPSPWGNQAQPAPAQWGAPAPTPASPWPTAPAPSPWQTPAPTDSPWRAAAPAAASTSSPAELTRFVESLASKGKVTVAELAMDPSVPQACVDAALKLQEMVLKGHFNDAVAIEALKLAALNNGVLDETVLTKAKGQAAANPDELARQAARTLQQAGMVSETDIAKAETDIAKHNNSFADALLSSGKIDKLMLQAAQDCQPYIADGRLRADQAIIALLYCQRSRTTFKDALGELSIEVL